MKTIKYILIFALLIGFSLALVRCTKDIDLKDSKLETKKNSVLDRLNSTEIISTLKSNGIIAQLINDKIENRSSINENCFTPGIYCQSYNITDTIVIPGYCGTHLVRYKVWICPGNTISITDFRSDPLMSCDSLYDSWLNLSDDQLVIAYDKYEYAASLVAEYLFISALNLDIQCPNYFQGADFYKNLCYQWCIEIIGRPGEDRVKFLMSKVFCGRKCCKRVIQYCYQNGVLIASTPSFSNVGTAECGTTPVGTCNGELIGDCERTCGVP
jgi:hypothetical protein